MDDRIRVIIAASTDQAIAGINRVKASISSLKISASSVWSGIASGLGALGISAGVNQAVQYIRGAIDEMDTLAKTARSINIKPQDLQATQETYKHAGLSSEDAAEHFLKLNSELEKCEKGLEKSSDKFARLGIRWQDLRSLSPVERLDAVIKSLQSMTDRTQASAAAAELLGSSGAKLLNMTESLAAANARVKANGNLFGDDELAAAEAFKDAMQDIESGIKSIVVNSGLVKWISEIVDGVEKLVNMTGYQKRAGLFTRQEAVHYAIQKAEESGKYSQYQLGEMKKEAALYGKGWDPLKHDRKNYADHEKGYDLLDKALREFGLGEAARNDHFYFSDQELFDRVKTPAERKAEANAIAEQKRLEAERAAEAERLREEAVQRKNKNQISPVAERLERQINAIDEEGFFSSLDPKEAFIKRKVAQIRDAYDAALVNAKKLPNVSKELLDSVTFTSDVEKRVREAASTLWDIQHPEGETEEKAEKPVIPPAVELEPTLPTYSYARMGATLAGAMTSPESTIRQTVNNIHDEIKNISRNMPTARDISAADTL